MNEKIAKYLLIFSFFYDFILYFVTCTNFAAKIGRLKIKD